jgi:hypothetical protein
MPSAYSRLRFSAIASSPPEPSNLAGEGALLTEALGALEGVVVFEEGALAGEREAVGGDMLLLLLLTAVRGGEGGFAAPASALAPGEAGAEAAAGVVGAEAAAAGDPETLASLRARISSLDSSPMPDDAGAAGLPEPKPEPSPFPSPGGGGGADEPNPKKDIFSVLGEQTSLNYRRTAFDSTRGVKDNVINLLRCLR